MDTLFRADMKADTFYINPSLKEQFKDDKDPARSEQMVKQVLQALYKRTKVMQEEYFEDGKYTETNTATGRQRTGVYTYDAKQGKLEKETGMPGDKQKFTVTWKDKQLVLTGELESPNGKKGKLEIVYEKI